MYITKNGIMINADVNGAANIGRKVIQNEEYFRRLDSRLAVRPLKINPLWCNK